MLLEEKFLQDVRQSTFRPSFSLSIQNRSVYDFEGAIVMLGQLHSGYLTSQRYCLDALRANLPFRDFS